MRPVFAALAGGGAAITAGLASWPAIGAVANSTFVGAIRLGGVAAELAWALPLGVSAGIAASGVAGLASQRAWPRTAFGALLIWAAVLISLLAMNFVPPIFAAATMALAFVTTSAIASRWRPRAEQELARSVLVGFVGLAFFAAAIVIVILVAVQVRPSGVTPDDWRRYKDPVDVAAAAATAMAGLATVAIARVVVARRPRGVVVSLLTLVALVVVTTPMLGFLSACYVGEVLLIFRWLVSPTC